MAASSPNIRHDFCVQPMLTDRQLWALGMIVHQWSLLEQIMDQTAKAMLRDEALAEYDGTNSFKKRRRIWVACLKTKIKNPYRDEYLLISKRIASLQQQRDDHVHGLFGGIREPHKENRHGGILRNISNVKGIGPAKKIDYASMRKLAIAISEVVFSMLMAEKSVSEKFDVPRLCDALQFISE